MARSGEAVRLPPNRSCHTPWNLPLPHGNMSNASSTSQLKDLPQIPQKHLASKLEHQPAREKTHNSSGVRLLKRADTLFAIVRELSNADIHERAHPRKELEKMIKADGHTLFEYHATFILRTDMESMADERDWTSLLVKLWKSLPKESTEWWRAHTEQILRAIEDELDLAVPRNFQTGDVTTVARTYTYRVKAAMYRQKVKVPKQQPGQTLLEGPRHQGLPRSQDARKVGVTSPHHGSPTEGHGVVHRKRFTVQDTVLLTSRPSKRLMQPGHAVINFFLSHVADFEPASSDTTIEMLLQSISVILKEYPRLQVHCRQAGARIVYKPDCFGVAGVAASLRAAAQKANEDGLKTHQIFNGIVRPFACCNLSSPAFQSVRSRIDSEESMYIPEDDASCLNWLGGNVPVDCRQWKQKKIVCALMAALRQHITRIGKTSSVALCYQSEEIINEVHQNVSSFGKWSVVSNSLGFEEQLLHCFDRPGLRPTEYEDLLEQRLYAFQQYTHCDFQLDRMVEK